MSDTRYKKVIAEGGMVINLTLSADDATIVRAIVEQFGEFIGTSDAIRVALRAYAKSADELKGYLIQQMETANRSSMAAEIAGRIIAEVVARREWSSIDVESDRAVDAAIKVTDKLNKRLQK